MSDTNRRTEIKSLQEMRPRKGPRPSTTNTAPHSQIDQLPAPEDQTRLSNLLVKQIATLEGIVTGGSRRAPPGTTGFHFDRPPPAGAERAFLLGAEFAHVHTGDDHSLHTVLPEPLRQAAIDAGWAEPHPMAGMPTVSLDTVMIYAPRDESEVDMVAALVRAAWQNAVAAAQKKA